jgi:hypothetical protein
MRTERGRIQPSYSVIGCPRGAMDSAPGFEPGGCEFESHRGLWGCQIARPLRRLGCFSEFVLIVPFCC